MNLEASPRLQEIPQIKPAVSAQARTSAGGRLLCLDNLRVFLTVLVVVHHLAITYGASGGWFYRERPTTDLAEILLSVFTIYNHFYFMGLFFLIAGYFVPGAVDRKGVWRFMQDRLVRLGIPLLIFGLLLSPFVLYVTATQEGRWSGSLGGYLVASWRGLSFEAGPLWFVEALLIFSLVYALGRAALERVKRDPAGTVSGTAAPAAGRALTHGRILVFIAALAVLSFAVRIVSPMDAKWANFEPAMFPQYALMFAAGALMFRRGWLPDLPAGVRRVWSGVFILAVASLPLFALLGSLENSEPFDGGLTWQSLLFSAWGAVYCTAISILLLGVFRRFFDRQGGLGQTLARSAYTVYIIHPLVLVGFALAVRGVALDPLMKYLLAAPLAVALCFGIAHLLVRRIPLADRVL
jgi:fucose 4-O-acetylase-like acetyltransferase